jgi:tRNA (Thr-GGU) A37 N-methylase
MHKNHLYISYVDMVDNTPVIDIKPYIQHFDHREDVISGWLEKHFKNRVIPNTFNLSKIKR